MQFGTLKVGQCPFKPFYFSLKEFSKFLPLPLNISRVKLALESEERCDTGKVQGNSGGL